MHFSQEIINWYRINKRDLPWRNTHNPYLIWLSEIILQQTRVEQGMPYFYKFVEAYPTIESFSNADEGEILRHWQGLGYYSRARNMLKTAKIIMTEYDGIFPIKYEQLIKLVGIGEYTASAIASFSSNEAKAVVDGNVYRVLSRYFGVSEPINSSKGIKDFQQLANSLLDNNNSGEHNQAMIEFGALQCKPRNPDCAICPLMINCYAYKNNLINNLPVKLKKVKVKERHFYYFVIIENNKILINKRGDKDIWTGLHDFPMIESAKNLTSEELINSEEFSALFPLNTKIAKIANPIKHVLTHQKIYGTFIEVNQIKHEALAANNWFWVNINDLNKYAQPKLIFAFLNIFLN